MSWPKSRKRARSMPGNQARSRSAATWPSRGSASAPCASPAPAFGARRRTGKRRCAPCSACRSSASISSTRPIPTGRTCPSSSSARRSTPIDGLVIATKAGFRRPGPDVWEMDGRPDYLRAQALKSRDQLGVEAIDLWQLHRIDPKVPREAQFAAIKALLDDGIIRHAGLSEVSVADIKAAAKVFPVATRAEPLQPRRSRQRGRARLLRGGRHRLHPVVSARRRRSRQARLAARRHRAPPQSEPQPDRARLGAEAQPGDAADPRHLEGQASGGERRGGERRICRTRSSPRSTARAARTKPRRVLVGWRKRSCRSGDDDPGARLCSCTRQAPEASDLSSRDGTSPID